MAIVRPVDGKPIPEAEPVPRRLGKYELIARIGEGGMAEVHLARMMGPMNFRKIVVVKTIHPDLASQEEFLRMLLDEARLSALIKHPRVVDIYELGQVGDTFFISMEYLDGLPMSKLLGAGARGNPLDPYAAAHIMSGAAEGLHAAHELVTISGKEVEVVHRDVSPANVMVLYDGTVKIVDFGIAKARGRIAQSTARQLKGKLGYMSPEQLTAGPIDRRSDVFSLGIVMWESLACRRLYAADDVHKLVDRMGRETEPPSTYRAQVPPQLDAICLRALQRDPAARYQTALEMKQALDGVLIEAGCFREGEAIAAHMARLFGEARRERNNLLRRRATTSAEVAIVDDVPVSRTRETTAPDTPAPLLTPTAPAAPAAIPAPAPRRRAWPWIAAVLGVGVAGGGALFALSGGASRPASQPATREPAPGRTMGGEPLPVALPAATPGGTAVATPPEPGAPAIAIATATTTTTTTTPAPAATRPATKTSAAALHAEGVQLFLKGEHERAKERFKAALAADRKHAASYRGLGLIYQVQGKKDRAVDAFQKYLRLSPGAADAASIQSRIAQLGGKAP